MAADDRRGTADGRPPGGSEVPAHTSVLDSVVVYAAGAVCRRRARVPVPPDGRLRLTGLPQVLDGRSLRARVLDGPPGTTVTEARLDPVAELRTEDELPELQRLLDEARERGSAIRERHRLVLSAIAETAGLRAVPPPRRDDEPHRRTPADAWLELAEFVDERLSGLHRRADGLAQELRLADHAIEVLTARLERASTAGPTRPVETSATVLLTLSLAHTPAPAPAPAHGTEPGEPVQTTEPAEAPELDLELEYGVPAARWVPAYRLSYRQGEDSGRLVLRASLAQQTGEDWTGVRLALSTADLDRRTDLPRLRSLRIGRSQPAPPPSGWREPPSGLADLFAGYQAAGPAPVPAGRAAAGPVASPRVGAASMGALPVAAAAPAPAAQPELFRRPGGSLAADEFPLPPPAFGGYGAPPPPGMPQPGGPAPRPSGPGRARRRGAEAAPEFSGPPPAPVTAPAPAAPGGAGPFSGYGPAAGFAPDAVPGYDAPPAPDAALLDYPSLVLAGPEEPAARRGTLQPPAPRPWVAAGSAVAALPLPRHAVLPRISAGSFDHRFDAAAPADIPSDGAWHTVTIGEIPVAVRSEYVTVPSVEEKVYGTLVLANRTAQAVLAGPVEVTVDDEFLLTAALPTLAPGGERRLGVGVTESVEVARRTELRESTAGMLNSSTVLDHRVHVELANRLGHPVTVEVRERVPVTSDAEVRIEERADWRAPAESSPDCPPSTRLWRVELPPGGRVELDGGYEIRIPAGKAIVGGNRRN
ncbi:DUF4139 domain-containing protein [Kitasatospora sp. NPDC048239]|uniref:DUF4139 domain-containing protein n=1 Tax=Kitasatospora sp. NPDC048239 TaxID=3364046 RepID=UPI00371C53DA